MKTISAILVLFFASVAPVAAQTQQAGWIPYQLPPRISDLPIVWSADCGGEVGCYDGGDTINVDPSIDGHQFRVIDWQPTAPLDEIVYLHEMGHWFDAHYMTPQLREQFEMLIGVAEDWNAPPNAPAEKFAQAFALCSLYPTLRSEPHWALIVYGYDPNRRQLGAACRLIDAAATASA